MQNTVNNSKLNIKSSDELLSSFFENDTISVAEVSEELLRMKRLKEIEQQYGTSIKRRKDGRQFYIYIDRKQINALTREALINQLYEMKYGRQVSSMADLYPEWMIWKRDNTSVSGKTLKEYSYLWNAKLSAWDKIDKPIKDLVIKDFLDLFRFWTKDRELTRKAFNNLKSILNGIYAYAIEQEIVSHNPIKEINCRQFPYKPVNNKNEIFTQAERTKILKHIANINDMYSLAIQLDFHIVARIGELLALKWSDIEGNYLHIQNQYLTTNEMNDDLTFSPKEHVNVDHIKGNADNGFRYMPLTNEALRILDKIRLLNPDGEYILMSDGRQLTVDTFNRRLKSYCSECGIKERSSHKIRFTTATMLYNSGVPLTVLQGLLGHTTIDMTLHYLRPITPIDETYEKMNLILG